MCECGECVSVCGRERGHRRAMAVVLNEPLLITRLANPYCPGDADSITRSPPGRGCSLIFLAVIGLLGGRSTAQQPLTHTQTPHTHRRWQSLWLQAKCGQNPPKKRPQAVPNCLCVEIHVRRDLFEH